MNKIFLGSAHKIAERLPEKSVDLIFTSPPYWKKRNYGTEHQIFGGIINCEHEWDENNFCDCGAWKGELGQEPMPELFVEHLANIFISLKPALKDTGVLMINIDDTYSRGIGLCNIKRKSLCAIPQRLTIKLMDAGYIFRNNITWFKPNPQPESVRDRFHHNCEPVLFFSKNSKYYFDESKVQIPWKQNSIRKIYSNINEKSRKDGAKKIYAICKQKQEKLQKKIRGMVENGEYPTKILGECWEITTQSSHDGHFAIFPEELSKRVILSCSPKCGTVLDPFSGSGTSLKVAKKYDRKYIGIELNPKFKEISEENLEVVDTTQTLGDFIDIDLPI